MPIGDITIVGVRVGLILFAAALIDIILYVFTKRTLIYGNTITPLASGLFRKRINPLLVVIIFGVIGALMLGGFGAAWANIASLAGAEEEEEIGPTLVPQDCIIEQVRYASISAGNDANAGNFTFVADDANTENYFIDTKNSTVVSMIASGIDINGTLVVDITDAPVTGSECNSKIYMVGPSYPNQIATSAATGSGDIYNLVDSGTVQSRLKGLTATNRVDNIFYEQNCYLNDGSVATSSSHAEETVLNFAAGEQRNTLGFAIDMEESAYDVIKKNNQVQFLIKQQVGDKPSASDPVIYTLTLRKGVLGQT